MSRFVRQSSYRHVYGTPVKKEKTHDNIKVSASAWDTNVVSASAKYLAVNYQSSGGGAFLVTPLDRTGKLPDLFPLCRAHTAPVLDTAFSPFDDALVASGGEDGKVSITRVDQSILDAAFSSEPEIQDMLPVKTWSAHGRKTGHVKWHPTADGIVTSASLEVKLWDVETQQARATSEQHPDMVQSFSYDYTGSTYATTCKDKRLRLFDPRAGAAAVTVAESHTGIKGSRVQWMGAHDRIVTTGFSRSSDRQVFVWDSKNLNKPLKTLNIDQSSGTLMPFWLEGNNVLFLAGKGDGNIRYYEYENDELYYLSEFSSTTPQRGMCLLPTRALDTHEHEIARVFKCTNTLIEPISFYVPRKSDSFQADIFPPAYAGKAALSAEEWFGGKTEPPVLVNLETHVEAKADVNVTAAKAAMPAVAAATAATVAPVEKKAEPVVEKKAEPAVEEKVEPIVEKKVEPVVEKEVEPAVEKKVEPVVAKVEPVVEEKEPAAVGKESESTSNKSTFDAPALDTKRVTELELLVSDLKKQISDRDAHIRELEVKLERVKAVFS